MTRLLALALLAVPLTAMALDAGPPPVCAAINLDADGVGVAATPAGFILAEDLAPAAPLCAVNDCDHGNTLGATTEPAAAAARTEYSTASSNPDAGPAIDAWADIFPDFDATIATLPRAEVRRPPDCDGTPPDKYGQPCEPSGHANLTDCDDGAICREPPTPVLRC